MKIRILTSLFGQVFHFDAKKEIILSLGVYELRGLARVLGVKSPTTKKREDLVSQILNILETNSEISLAEIEKRGRPFKALTSVQNIIDVISTQPVDEVESLSKFSTFEEITVFNQEMPPITLQSSDIFPSAGVFRKGRTFGYFVDSTCQRIVYISPEYVQRYNLVTGDFLDCAVFEINNSNNCYIKKINKVNGLVAEEYFPTEFNEYSQTLPKQRDFDGKQILMGGKNVLITQNPLYLNKDINQVLDNFESDRKVFLGVNACFEDKSLITNKGEYFLFTSNYEDKISSGYDRIIDAINFVERMKKLNESVLLVVSDFANVLNVLDTYFHDEELPIVFGHKDKTVVVAKKLISLAMSKTNNRDATSIIVCNKIDLEDQFIKNELVKISNIIE